MSDVQLFPTLYKRDSKGSIIHWNIRIETYTDSIAIIKEYGKSKIGNVISKKDTLPTSTDPIPLVNKDISRKRKEGYLSVEDLNITSETIEEEGSYYTVYIYQQERFKDMNDAISKALNILKSFSITVPDLTDGKLQQVTYPCIIQPVKPGVRAIYIGNANKADSIVTVDGTSVKFLDTLRKELNCLDKLNLEGFLCIDNQNEAVVSSYLNVSRKDCYDIKYYIYDVLGDYSLEDRLNNLTEYANKLAGYKVKVIESYIANDYGELLAIYNKLLNLGYTEIYTKCKENTYRINSLSDETSMLDKFTFLYWEFGLEGINDMQAICASNNLLFACRVLGSKTDKEKLYYMPKSLAYKEIEVKHFGLSEEGVPRLSSCNVKDLLSLLEE